MSKLRLRIGTALLVALTALAALGGTSAFAQHGADDPCPHRVEVGPNCQ